ncbi:acylphosphatase [Candidatus Micrarchaeota archaeon]|nr:acylphosphatase [Candidatus Micrarchaeota archaeon]
MIISRVRIFVIGKVQGVSFRSNVKSEADKLQLVGFARNTPDGKAVEVYAEGDSDALGDLIAWCTKGPEGAQVRSIEYSFLPDQEQSCDSFEIVENEDTAE